MNGAKGGQLSKLSSLHGAVENLDMSLKQAACLWAPGLDKMMVSMKNMESELLAENESGDLSVTAQIILEQSADRAFKITNEYMQQNKAMHLAVSKIGKCIDRNYSKDIGNYFACEKDIESFSACRDEACSAIFDFLMNEGLIGVAETLREESLLHENEVSDDPHLVEQLMIDILSKKDVSTAIEFLGDSQIMDSEASKLLFELQKQQILSLVSVGDEKAALGLLKRINFSHNHDDAPKVMGALLRGKSSVTDDRYKSMFQPAILSHLAHRVAQSMAPLPTCLDDVLQSGRGAAGVLSSLKKTLSKGSLSIDEELPVEIKVRRMNHSSFTCPILKEQCSEFNPPMKLQCGHVISKEAMNRLSASRLLNPRGQAPRQMRLKCPYCPKEQSFESAKQVLFCSIEE